MTGALRSILAKEDAAWSAKERSMLREHIDRFASLDREKVYACVSFVLGNDNENRTRGPLLSAFAAAKRDLSAGEKLPPEVLEGIRSVFHKGTPKEEVLRITADRMTKAQRMLVQKRAAAANVDVKMDPADYDAVRLYVYAFEMGMTEAIARALIAKAREAAASFPVRYASIGVLVDASASMMGGADQKLRPMATALAVRDMLQHVGRARVVICGGAVSAAASMVAWSAPFGTRIVRGHIPRGGAHRSRLGGARGDLRPQRRLREPASGQVRRGRRRAPEDRRRDPDRPPEPGLRGRVGRREGARPRARPDAPCGAPRGSRPVVPPRDAAGRSSAGH